MTPAPDPYASIVPDTKDWTWVLDARCGDCGVDAREIDFRRVPDLLRANAAAWDTVLRRSDVAHRPSPQTWSPLEYACHVRDVFSIFELRLHRMLAQDAPHFDNWDQDATAADDNYGAQDPDVVATTVNAAAHSAARAFATVRDDQRSRIGLRSDGATFTVESMAQYFVHDLLHHIHDVGMHPSVQVLVESVEPATRQ